MEAVKVNLHLQRKNIALCLLGYLAIVLLLTMVVAVSTVGDLAQMQAIVESDYAYSAVASNSAAADTYYQYSAGISFSVSEEANVGISAEVVMQTENAQYTDLVSWNTDRLSKNTIAISENIASANGLAVGDVLYSKNVVDGKIHEFTIEAILSSVTYTRGYKGDFHNDGVIIMAYDSKYADNIAHTCIMFTQKPIEELAQLCSSMPEDIIYRDDEIISLVKCIAPYIAVYFLGIAATTAIFAAYLNKSVAHNFRRLIMLGFERNTLNKAYYGYVGVAGLSAIATTLIVAAIAFARSGQSAVVPVIGATAIGASVLIIAATSMNKHLWRK